MLHPLRLALLCAALAPLAPAQDLLVRSKDVVRFPAERPDQPERTLSIPGSGDDLHQLPNGNLLVRIDERALIQVLPTDATEVWRWEAAEGRQLATSGLASGGVLVGVTRPLQALEIDGMGREVRSTDLPGSDGELHSLALTPRGTYLACYAGTASEVEPGSGKVLWSYRMPEETGQVLSALSEVGGNTLVGTAHGQILGLDAQGKESLRIGPTDIEGIQLRAVAGLQRLDDGTLCVLNRSAGVGQPLVFALDLNTRKVQWALNREDFGGAPPVAVHVLHQGQDAELLRRARQLHRDVLTLDTHKDISDQLAADAPAELKGRALEAFTLANDPTVWGSAQVDFPKMLAGGLDVAFYIVYAGQGTLDEEGFRIAAETGDAKFDAIHRMCERYPDQIELARSAADVERIAAAGKLVCCIGIENGYVMGTDIGRIAEFHERGARYMSLTHNRHSQLGDSYTPDEPLHGGLTELGRQAVVELNRVGILVDVSHASKDTMMQATALSKAPVIASHSGARAVRDHGRNLDDEQLRALAANGGVIQCVAFSSYVTDTGAYDAAVRAAREELGLPRRRGFGPADTSSEAQEKRRKLRARVAEIKLEYPPSDVSDFVDHIVHAVKVAGIDHVAISSDFDGGGGIVGWNDASETFAVTLELCRRGYSAEDIEQLWSGNTLRIWRQVEQVAEQLQSAEDR